MFATLGSGDDESPWEPHWAEPHHPFVAPAPPTFTHLARSIADHALDLEADEELSWETAGFDSLAEELVGAYPHTPDQAALTPPLPSLHSWRIHCA